VLLKILRYLNEVERRRLYVPRGYASLYDFCTDYLGYSRSGAMRRIHAARCIERFPQVAELLRSGEFTLTVAAMISRVLTEGNAEEIISYVRGKSTRDVEMLVARHQPDFMLRDRVRPVCVMVPDLNKNDSSHFPGAGKNLNQHVDNKADKNRGVSADTMGIESDAPAPAVGPTVHSSGAATDSAGCEPGPEEVERVLITQKYKLEFAVDQGFMEKLGRVRSFLSTKYPGGLSLEAVFDITMTDFLDRHSPEGRVRRRSARRERKQEEKTLPGNKKRECPDNEPSDRDKHSARKGGERCRKALAGGREALPVEKQRGLKPCGGVRRSTGRSTAKRSRHILPAVRDEVFTRDGSRCTFIGDDGKRCDSDWNLQIDHIVPFAKGGNNSPENLRLLCAKHNRLAAEKAYGKNHMDKFYGGT
jgi:5-methylcytosine-specific restriction endonuclease McrA